MPIPLPHSQNRNCAGSTMACMAFRNLQAMRPSELTKAGMGGKRLLEGTGLLA